MINPSALCSYCNQIPWLSLPSELDPGLPHQPSLRALRLSADTCSLCHLILQTAMRVRERIDNEHRGKSEGEWWSHEFRITPEGPNLSLQAYEGVYSAGSDGRTSVYAEENSDWAKNPGYPFLDDSTVRPWLYGGWWYCHPHKEQLQLLGLGVRLAKAADVISGEGNGKQILTQNHGLSVNVVLHGTDLRVATADETAFSVTIPYRLRDSDASSSRNFDRIRRWIYKCKYHHSCGAWESPLPTRVLVVDVSLNFVILKETTGSMGSYATLSYCWGASGNLTTTRSTLELHKSGIPIRNLPKTMQDAVLVCQNLRIPHLWVDALCIIQDNEHDRDREISKMGEIYAHSYLTIAASSGGAATDGLFASVHERKRREYVSAEAHSLGKPVFANAAPLIESPYHENPPTVLHQHPLAVPTLRDGHRKSELYIYKEWLPSSTKSKPRNRMIGFFGRYLDPFEYDALSNRGWTLQERILSPRIIHFQSDQMLWECRCRLESEDGSVFGSKSLNLDRVVRGQLLPFGECGLASVSGLSLTEGEPVGQNGGLVRGGRWNDGWLLLVEEFCKREFTWGDDKLPALAGLARYLANVTGDEYYAGLWRNYVLEDLCWRVFTRLEDKERLEDGSYVPRYGPIGCEVRKPASYRAPTWSWASLDSHIRFIPLDLERAVAEFIVCYVEPSGEDVFGKVKHSWLKFWAPVFQVLPNNPLTPVEYADKRLCLGTLVELHLEHGTSKGEAFFDLQPTFPCYGIFLDPQNCILATKRVTGEQEYERVGLARFMRTRYQRQVEPFATRDQQLNKVPWGPITGEDRREFVTIY